MRPPRCCLPSIAPIIIIGVQLQYSFSNPTPTNPSRLGEQLATWRGCHRFYALIRQWSLSISHSCGRSLASSHPVFSIPAMPVLHDTRPALNHLCGQLYHTFASIFIPLLDAEELVTHYVGLGGGGISLSSPVTAKHDLGAGCVSSVAYHSDSLTLPTLLHIE